MCACVCVGARGRRRRRGKDEGRHQQPIRRSDGYCPKCPVVDGAGVGEGLWLSLHCARFSPVVSTATENTVVCL